MNTKPIVKIKKSKDFATPAPAVDHTQAISEAAREYVRAIEAWVCGTHPYPAAAADALIATVYAERADKKYKP